MDGPRRNARLDHAGRRDEALAALDDVIDAVENEAGRPPTDEEGGGRRGKFPVEPHAGREATPKWEDTDGPDVERRTVSVPLHERVRTGTLRGIAENAGAEGFDAFCKRIARNRSRPLFE